MADVAEDQKNYHTAKNLSRILSEICVKYHFPITSQCIINLYALERLL